MVACGACSSEHQQRGQTQSDHTLEAGAPLSPDASSPEDDTDPATSRPRDAASTAPSHYLPTVNVSDAGGPGVVNPSDIECEAGGDSCQQCGPGWFCPEGEVPTICQNQTWDHDLDPTTPCVPVSTCTDNEYELSAPGPSTDRRCMSITPCGPGSYVAKPSDGKFDQTCEPCTEGSFSSETDQLECKVWTECGDLHVVNPGSPTEDRVCFSITRGSVTAMGGEADGAAGSLSSDGALLAFTSTSGALVSDDDNGVQDVFVKDLRDGAVVRANVDSDGRQSVALAHEPRISHDGRFVVFTSQDDALVNGDTNAADDVFVKDLHSGTLELVSRTAQGVVGSLESSSPSISYDGQRVAFLSSSSNLIRGDNHANRDVFVKDIVTGELTRASTTTEGLEIDGACFRPRISGDGAHVVFSSSAHNLVVDDFNGTEDVFIKDLASGLTRRVSVDATGAEGGGSSHDPVVSLDGRYVAFRSSSELDGKNSLTMEVFLKDVATGAITRLSGAADGEGGYCLYPSISGDGRFVAFYSRAATGAPTNASELGGVHIVDTREKLTRRLSVNAGGELAADYAYCDDLSADGRFVAMSTEASNLIANDTNDASDVFVVRSH